LALQDTTLNSSAARTGTAGATVKRTSSSSVRRDPDDDFFCLRFGVCYPSFDCAYRTKHRTCPGCADCEQGRFNLQRHRTALRLLRLPATDS